MMSIIENNGDVTVKIGNKILELQQGDITRQSDIDAITNAANAQLKIGGGVAGAIHRAAGQELYLECKPLAPIRPGQAVITKGYNLPNDYVIHCLGPVFGIDKPEGKLLTDCYINSLLLADKHKLKSVAFPAISTGAFGYPLEEAAVVILSAIKNCLPGLHHVQKVRLVLYEKNDLRVFREKLNEIE